jgi:phage anti-repressor protein
VFEGGSIEVGKPQGFEGNLDYGAFRDAVESYYRNLVGSSGRAIKIQGGRDIRMINNWLHAPMKAQITVEMEGGGW